MYESACRTFVLPLNVWFSSSIPLPFKWQNIKHLQLKDHQTAVLYKLFYLCCFLFPHYLQVNHLTKLTAIFVAKTPLTKYIVPSTKDCHRQCSAIIFTLSQGEWPMCFAHNHNKHRKHFLHSNLKIPQGVIEWKQNMAIRTLSPRCDLDYEWRSMIHTLCTLSQCGKHSCKVNWKFLKGLEGNYVGAKYCYVTHGATLTFSEGRWLLCSELCLNLVNICVKFFKIPCRH